MNITILEADGLSDISGELLDHNGRLKLLSYKEYEKFDYRNFRFFCHQYARYGIPTKELIDQIKIHIGGRSSIEIGSGHGDLGYHLGIPMTDSKQQFKPVVRAWYKAAGQPIIQYLEDVEEIDALEAVKKYKPQVVVASWVTPYSPFPTTYGSNPWGVKEDEILPLIETYILIGNIDTHGERPILTRMNASYASIEAPWIISRAFNPGNNRIYIIDNKG